MACECKNTGVNRRVVLTTRGHTHTPVAETYPQQQRTSAIDQATAISAESVETATCPQHRALLNAAVRCESSGARLLGQDPARIRTRALLTTLATQIRAAAVVFVLDPTLAQEPQSPRWRSMDLLVEMSRQLLPLLQQAWDTRRGATATCPIPELWAEAIALHERAIQIAQSIPDLVPRHEPTSSDGQRAISIERLAPHSDTIAEAAALIRHAAALALMTTNPDPRAVELDTVADRLDRIAVELDDLETPDVLPRPGTH